MIRQLHHIAIVSHNPARLAKFYQNLFDLENASPPDPGTTSTWLELEGGTLLMFEKSTRIAHDLESDPDPVLKDFSEKAPGIHLISFGIEIQSRTVWEQRLLQMGIPLAHQSPFSLYFLDPEGNRLCLSHYPHRAPDLA